MTTAETIAEILRPYIADEVQRMAAADRVDDAVERLIYQRSADFAANMMTMITPRQREIVALLDAGKHAQEVADALGISIYTVREHTRVMREKYRVPSTPALVAKLRGLVNCGNTEPLKKVAN